MIPFSMVRRRIVWCSCLVMFMFMGSMMIFSFYMPIYFQTVRNATPTMSGVYILPAILSQVLFATVSGVLGRSLDPATSSRLIEVAATDKFQLADLDIICPGALPVVF